MDMAHICLAMISPHITSIDLEIDVLNRLPWPRSRNQNTRAVTTCLLGRTGCHGVSSVANTHQEEPAWYASYCDLAVKACQASSLNCA